MKLIGNEELVAEVERLKDELIKVAKENSITIELLLDYHFGYSLKVYILFTYMLSISKIGNLSEEDVFYNRYFWFTMFSKLKERKEGYDAGINQQSVRLLEEIDYNHLNIDWSLIQQIEDNINDNLSE